MNPYSVRQDGSCALPDHHSPEEPDLHSLQQEGFGEASMPSLHDLVSQWLNYLGWTKTHDDELSEWWQTATNQAVEVPIVQDGLDLLVVKGRIDVWIKTGQWPS